MPATKARRFKDAIYRQLARIGKAVASPRRLELLDLLAQGPRTVERLASESGQTVANTSQHLQLLRRARLVEAQKQGLYVTYRLADQGVAEFYRGLRALAESRLGEIHRVTRDFLADRGALEAVDQEVLVARVLRGEVTLLDVRPVEEYAAGHIVGAVSVPLRELERRLASFPKRRQIVAYCRGPYCVLAIEAVARLRALGFKALRLEDGVPDWRARGLPVAVGAA
ncbi:MAG: metalloregulator ArsR/SmtB family transcription factor [Gemmatimonadetes bacterium]|nr:metalloregulator ArsR/SmtB family transcription factor [Gemmatimonadota bacterium]